jgi:ABC-type Mn2+/Zn2+ transport system ATPase subunit
MDDIVVKIDNAVVSYRENIALRGASLQVRDGEFIGVIGPNGAGKTTLLTLINGLGKLVSGDVCVLGHRFTPHNGHSLRKKIGYVAQAQDIDPRMPLTVEEVTLLGRYGKLGIFRSPKSHDRKIAAEMLELVGMTHLAKRPVGHLSGGEQQRMAIARCLTQEPDLFLLDEPTASLDWRGKTDILSLVKMIHTVRKLTTLFVTHDLSALPLACDRIIMMKDGLIWNEGAPDQVLTDDNLSKLYDIPLSDVKERRTASVLSG